MRTKKKIVAIVQIAIVLCSLFLVALPVIAADQNQTVQKVSANAITTASEDDYVLDIYGNANEDDTIDMGDVVYTKLAIFGKKPKTELCDAKYDGRINVLDVIQTKLIILGKEKELTVIDSTEPIGRIVTVKKPLRRIVVCFPSKYELLRSLKVTKDVAIVGVAKDHPPYDTAFFPEIRDIPSVGDRWNPDVEEILNIHPDAVIVSWHKMESLIDALEPADIPVLGFVCQTPWIRQEEVKRLGYIFGKQNEAEELIEFYENVMNSIKDKVDKIPEENKPKVYYESSKPYRAYGKNAAPYVALAGGEDILPDAYGSVDPEAVIEGKPDFIIKNPPSRIGGYDKDVGDTTEIEEVREEIMSRPELQKVAAVENGRVYIVSGHIKFGGGVSGCRTFIGIAYMAKWFHPTLFEDLDPKAIHQEYLTRFQGLDVDLGEKGVFVYHPVEHPDGS